MEITKFLDDGREAWFDGRRPTTRRDSPSLSVAIFIQMDPSNAALFLLEAFEVNSSSSKSPSYT